MTVGCSMHSRASATRLRGLKYAPGLLGHICMDDVCSSARQGALVERKVRLRTCLPRKTRWCSDLRLSYTANFTAMSGTSSSRVGIKPCMAPILFFASFPVPARDLHSQAALAGKVSAQHVTSLPFICTFAEIVTLDVCYIRPKP